MPQAVAESLARVRVIKPIIVDAEFTAITNSELIIRLIAGSSVLSG